VQGEAIAEVIDFVVGMGDAILDEAAIAFAASFYRALAFHRSVQEAFDLGRAALLAEDIPEEDVPALLVKPDVDAATTVLVGRVPPVPAAAGETVPMSAPIFRHLCGVALLKEYKYAHMSLTQREWYFLRDNGLIEPRPPHTFRDLEFDERRHGQNFAAIAQPTERGWAAIRRRRQDIPAELLEDPANLKLDPTGELPPVSERVPPAGQAPPAEAR
jgi:hypothetical protein